MKNQRTRKTTLGYELEKKLDETCEGKEILRSILECIVDRERNKRRQKMADITNIEGCRRAHG